MVFESLVSDLLNRFIGDYVENLDKSQLKIGIWGGNVVLENLKVKENALSELNVPFKVKAGQVGKLTLKIPWKNLYTEAVVATLDGVYLLVVPGARIKYDAAKEERYQQEAKQKELLRIEEALQIAARRNSQMGEFVFNLENYVYKDPRGRKHKKHKKPFRMSKKHEQKTEKLQEEKKDTFAEKLATQIIKNLEVKVTNIHIRYEDDISDPQRPLAMGVTLSELSLQTANENWGTRILNEATKVIYKLGCLQHLCAYWNINSPIFYKGSWEEIVEKMKTGIGTGDKQLKGYQYIFKPINATAKICINPNAEIELKSQKVYLEVEVQNIAVEITKPQYLTMIELLESIDFMVKNSPYRKFRPDVPVYNHAKQWWMYGINSVLEVHIKRFNQMWSWTHIIKHRQRLKAYKAAYKTKMTQNKIREDTEKQILELEKVLDVFNITLARQQAQMEVMRSGQKLVTKKAAAQKQGGGGFFTSFFGRKEGKKKEHEEEVKEPDSIDAILTTEEKTKLYTAIGYSESSHNQALPENYVAVIVKFKLLRTSVTVREETSVPEILKVQMIDLNTTISLRPGAQAIKVEASLEHWYVTGLQQHGVVPYLISSVGDLNSSLLSVVFELNPENTNADQLLRVYSQPIEIIYDALTINSLIEFFKTGKGMDLEVITSATLSKLEEIKEKTTSGLAHIIKTHKVLDLKIDLKPSYLLVPKGGFYHSMSDLIIIDFGSLLLSTVTQESNEQAESFSSMEEIMDRAYERFSLELRTVQVLYSKSGEMWKSARLQGSSIQHVLQPMDFTLQLAKCMVERDLRMPRFKIFGELPLLHVKISDLKIQWALELLNSIPLPIISSTTPSTPSEKALPGPLADSRPTILSLDPSALQYSLVSDSEEDSSERSFSEDAQKSMLEEFVDIHFKFEIKTLLLELTRQAAQEDTVLALNVSELGTEGKMRTYDLTVTSYLHKIRLDYCGVRDAENQPLHLMTSDKHGSDLLKVEYIKADMNGPSFQTLFDNTEQMLKVEFSSLKFMLHTEVLVSTINFLNTVIPQELTSNKQRDTRRPDNKTTTEKPVTNGSKDSSIVSFKFLAIFDSLGVVVCDDGSTIADIRIQGIHASMLVQAKEMEVSARLLDIVVLDVDSKSVHEKVVSIVGEEVFSFKICLYPGAMEDGGYTDTSKVDSKVTLRLGCIQIVYLHKFIMSLLAFVDNFQVAKEALSVATAQAAEKAACSVKDLAQKSYRLSMDIRLKAPLIIIPESSTSHNAFVMDLGLITLCNSFSLTQVEGFFVPAVMERVNIELTQLKLMRTVLGHDAPSPDFEILQPINLELFLTRNMSATWYTKIPGLEVKGVLKSINISLCQEDVCVLMRTLSDNFRECGRTSSYELKKLTVEGNPELAEERKEALPVEMESQLPTSGNISDITADSVILNFEIMEVQLTLKKPKDGNECPFLVLHAAQLGIDTIVHKYDMLATTYIKTISVKSLEFQDSFGEPLCILSSAAEQQADLLKVQYCNANCSGPKFAADFENTKQTIHVIFSSLDLMLYTEAVLSTMDFLSAALSYSSLPSPEKESKSSEETSATSAKSIATCSPSDGDVIDMKILMQLGEFSLVVCDQKCSMAELKIQGLRGSFMMKGSQTHVSASLQDFVIINVDPKTIHRKTVSIVGNEVFRFSMSLTPKATEGEGYGDTSKVDGKVKLNVGCIQVVYVHKFVMSLLNFSNNFQMAKNALSMATAQAAVKAVSSVRDFTQKSFRLSMDINMKAPLIIIPQSSTSCNAVEADLGLITVRNTFSLIPVKNCPLPAIIDNIDLELTQLKLSRICMGKENPPRTELLKPVNLVLSVKRNLAATWYQMMAAVEVDGDLKPMKVSVSQEDLTVVLKILMENIGEASNIKSSSSSPNTAEKQASISPGAHTHTVSQNDGGRHSAAELVPSVKCKFSIVSLSLVLYSDDPTEPGVHQEHLCLGEFMLYKMTTSAKMYSDGSLDVSTNLCTCSLDDRRSHIERVTSRMLGKQDKESTDAMIDMTYSQSGGKCSVVAVLRNLYLCASVEFLMAVGDFFVQALPKATSTALDKPSSIQNKEISEPNIQGEPRKALKTTLQVLVVDPDVVFVADLTKADAPALVASFQCDFSLLSDETGQVIKINLGGLKVLACPFIRNQDNKAVTTVLRPCSVVVKTTIPVNAPVTGSVTVEEIIVKISPIILNTVLTITAAMAPKPKEKPLKKQAVELSTLWAVRNIYTCNYWFLNVEAVKEVTQSFTKADCGNEGQIFKADVKVVQVTLESGLGHHTVPLLLAESSFTGCAQNWSSLLSVSADLTLEVNYFNESHAVWEPFIERVDNGGHRWNLKIEMKNNPDQDKSPVLGDDMVLPDPCTAINIYSKDTMNITLSRCCLNVFHNLAQAFSEGAVSTFKHTLKEKAPFTILNSLGISLTVQHNANLRVTDSSSRGNVHELGVEECMDLEYSIYESSARGKLSVLQRQESCLFHLSIVPKGYSEISDIPIDKPGRRLYNVWKPMLQKPVSVLLQIDATKGNKVITVRSPLQIKNHFSVPFAIVRYSTEVGTLVNVGIAEPEKEFDVTLDSYRCHLFLLPVGPLEGQYRESTTCISWKEQIHRSSEVRSLLQCPSQDSSYLPLLINTVAVPDNLCHIASHGEEDWDPAYIIHLHPVVVIRNLLPYTIRYLMEGSPDFSELQEGSAADVLNARVMGEIIEFVLVKYQGRNWNGHVKVSQDMPELFPVCFSSDTSEKLFIDVCMHVGRVGARYILTIFSPYWLINKTSRVLQYRAEDIHVKHPSSFQDVILFSFKKKNIFSKNKLQLCVSTSSWSDGFSLDTVGSYGCVRCQDKNMDYLVGISIKLSNFNLTRIVTMSPFYTLVNKSSFELEVGEVQNGNIISKWHYISSAECLPLWPESSTVKLCVRVVGCESVSKSFFFTKQDNGTLLCLEQYGGIIVDVNISDHSTVISLTDYYDGAAPALLVNHTPWVTIIIKQSGCEATRELKPGEAQLFVWEDPTGMRKLCWLCQGQSGELDLVKDECGQFASEGLGQVYWVSFLDGRQRIMLFTEDVDIVKKAHQAEELRQVQQEVSISLQNLGLSLINDDNRCEVAYVGITSSGVVWEMRPKNRWKSFNQKNISVLEKAFQNHISGKTEPGWLKLETGIEVTFARRPMLMRHPYSCSVRRKFLPGIHIELKQSRHQRSLRAQLHWLQVDNQLTGAIFPVVFHPVPPPKSIALDSEPKPFIDVSIITRFNEHSQMMQFKYFMVLVQEMAVKIDQGFLWEILALFTPTTETKHSKQRIKLIERDLEALQTQLLEYSVTDISTLTFFEHFHISPVKLHLSLSLGCSGTQSERGDMLPIESVNLLLKSIGATLTDVDDLVFKLAFFEVKYQFFRREDLMLVVFKHYTEQFLKQMYVLVLGLDVLGNPFGLIRGLSEGVEAFFYEPFQGAVQGPEEFAEGFVIGVRSLLGHTVGGAAGMVSRITGSVGKGLAAITMDKEYQQKRREEMNRPSKDFGASLAKGGKGLLKGVVGGVTGIVTKPVEGAKKEGAAGFFKGIGKGLVGVVARPTGGIVDMASSTFQGIQRVAESTEEVTKLRPVRLIREDGIIRPYNQQEAQGYDLFQRSMIKQLSGEFFIEHYEYPGHKKNNIIITNRRVMCVKEIELIGHFTKEWECHFEHFLKVPCVEGGDLKIYYKEQNKLKILNDGQEPVKVLHLKQADTAEKLRYAIQNAQLAHQQYQMVRQKSQRFTKSGNAP